MTTSTTTAGTTMRAIIQENYGEAENVLRLGQTGRPAIGDGEVLLRVHAAGVDRGVWHLVAGLPHAVRLAGYGVWAPEIPVPGREVAGRVEAVGGEVTALAVGDEVFGIAEGSFAEYARARADKLASKPFGLTFVQAAAVPVSGLTALQAVRDRGHVQAGQQVLVIGASGGVGTFAVQIAKAHGADVTGVCSTAKADLAQSVGADRVIDYTCDDITDSEHRYDVILDTGATGRCGSSAAPCPPRKRWSSSRRDGRALARRKRPSAPGRHALPVHRPAPGHAALLREPGGPARAHGADRVRPGHTGHRQDLPAERDHHGHPAHARRSRPGQGHH
jgi:NADPH:quinone reductase-like Zn-dependent oxidoreductase